MRDKARGLPASPAPFIHAPHTTASLSRDLFLALLPALAWGVYCFGLRALVVVLASSSSALLSELLVLGLKRRRPSLDLSPLVTGLLVGMAMPPGVPLRVPVLAAAFAVLLVRNAFGGLGSNWMNPAAAGIGFAFLGFPVEMTTYTLPRQLSGFVGLSGATPLGFLRDQASGGTGFFEALKGAGYAPSSVDRAIGDFLNHAIFGRLGAELPPGYIDLFLGLRPGSIGELPLLLLLLSSIVLISRGVIRWSVPLAVLGSTALISRSFGGLAAGEGLFTGDILLELGSGSLVFVAFFMATDPVTSPRKPWAVLVYGFGIALLTFLIRRFGARAEGSAFALLAMNCLVPWMDRPRLPASATLVEEPR